MNKILIDTNILIETLRLKNKETSTFIHLFIKGVYNPVISHITISELWAGKSMADEKKHNVVIELIKNLEVIYPDLEIAQKTGEILRNYDLSFQDAQIAAISLSYNLPLLTLNHKDFQKIKGIKFFTI